MCKARLIHVDIGKETISATPEHPFWVQGIGWVDASELSAGDGLSLADGGTATIVSVMRERLESPRDVYNFEVEGFHAYFVASAGVWVHNACAAKLGRQGRLKEIAGDPKVSKAIRGQMMTFYKQKGRYKNPPGYELAHRKGREAFRGVGYEGARLQLKLNHRIEHWGRAAWRPWTKRR